MKSNISTFQLKHHASLLEQAAADCRAMAKTYEAMPNPLGEYVVRIAIDLARYGLCVVDRGALQMAVLAMETFEPSDDEDFPGEAKRRSRVVGEALRAALAPIAPVDAPPSNPSVSTDITDAEIDAVGEAMPGGLTGFCKGWGWRQFAREVIEANDRRRAAGSEAKS